LLADSCHPDDGRTSETSVLTKATQRNISEDGILHSHHRENLKSYIALTDWAPYLRRIVSPVRYELDVYIPEDGIPQIVSFHDRVLPSSLKFVADYPTIRQHMVWSVVRNSAVLRGGSSFSHPTFRRDIKSAWSGSMKKPSKKSA
jgi:hypothetical protein